MRAMRRVLTALSLGWAAFFFVDASAARAADSSSLAQVIEGAKKEGTVSIQISPSAHTPASIKRLSREIKGRYGVDLDIQFAASERMAVDLSKALMEHKLGSVPTYDLMSLTLPNILRGAEAGVFEKVDWRSMIDKGTPPEIVIGKPGTPYYGTGLTTYTAHRGLMYNPRSVAAGKVPKTLAELADPRWKGKVGIHNYPRVWAELAFISGREKILSELRAILKNGVIQGSYADLQKRYILEEIWLVHSGSAYLQEARMKGMPAEWQSLEVSDILHNVVSVRTRAKHPNAAKLAAVYLASPEGSKLSVEEAGAGNFYYPGNYEHALTAQDRRQGLTEFAWDYPGRMEFVLSKQAGELEKEIERIFKTVK